MEGTGDEKEVIADRPFQPWGTIVSAPLQLMGFVGVHVHLR
jgi:hypothetical protein